MSDNKNGIRDRLTGDGVLFGDDKGMLWGVLELNNAIFGRFEGKLVNSIIYEIPRQGPDLFHQVDLVGVGVCQGDLTVCIGAELPQRFAILDADFKDDALQRLKGHAVDFLYGEGWAFAILHSQGRCFPGNQLYIIVGVIRSVSGGAAELVDLVPTRFQTIYQNRPIGPGGHIYGLATRAAGNAENRSL